MLFASLRPFRGWRIPDHSLFAFIWQPERARLEHPDVILNLLGYMPLGFLLVLVLVRWMREPGAFVAAIATALLASLSVEFAQNFLPMRHPSRIDVVMNALGACVGATAAIVLLPILSSWSRPIASRAHRLERGPKLELGVLLIGVWWFAMFAPSTLLFGAGNLRRYLDLPSPPALDVGPSSLLELGVALSCVAMIAALVRAFAVDRRIVLWVTMLVVGVALAARASAFGFYWGGRNALGWATPGSVTGVVLGIGGAMIIAAIPAALARRLALGVLVVHWAGVNAFAPPQPIVSAARLVYLDLARVAEFAASVWLVAVLAYLVWWGRSRAPRHV